MLRSTQQWQSHAGAGAAWQKTHAHGQRAWARETVSRWPRGYLSKFVVEGGDTSRLR